MSDPEIVQEFVLRLIDLVVSNMENGNDSNVANEKPSQRSTSPEKQPDSSPGHVNDEIPTKSRNVLKVIQRKIRKVFMKKGRKGPCNAYLDGYKSIADDDLKPVINEEFSTPRCLGYGSSGVVHLMTLNERGKETLVAVKSFLYDGCSNKKKKRINTKIANELKAMDRLRDIPEVPGVIGVCKNNFGYHIVMEFIGDEQTERSTSLNQSFLKQCGDDYTKKRDVMWLRVLLDVANALHQMHARGVLHGDVTARNVLLYRNEQNTLAGKLIDYGSACNEDKPRWFSPGRFKTEKVTREILENHDWGAPEFAKGTWWRRGGYHSKASDIWAFGQMLTDMSELLTTSTADDLTGLIDVCTTVDPKLRASTEYIQSELRAVILKIQLNYLGCRESILI